MTREHFFPKWLIDHADVRRDGIEWLGKRGLDPNSATIPLCDECNNTFANVLEGPVSSIFRGLDRGEALSDLEAELVVRWMWKFEGLQWALYAADRQLYTERWSLHDRVTKPEAFADLRPRLMLAMATCHANDAGFEDWPLGIDTPPGDDAITMSGVFRRVAIITSLVDFADQIPDVYGKYAFGMPPHDRSTKVFLPPCSFINGNGAIAATKETALRLSSAHRSLGQELRQLPETPFRGIIPVRSRVELPPT